MTTVSQPPCTWTSNLGLMYCMAYAVGRQQGQQPRPVLMLGAELPQQRHKPDPCDHGLAPAMSLNLKTHFVSHLGVLDPTSCMDKSGPMRGD